MTQLQKAIVIAKKDGWVHKGAYYEKITSKGDVIHIINCNEGYPNPYELYTTDLNYLMPIAVKVLRDLAIITDPFDTDQYEKFDTFIKLNNAYLALSLDSNNQYTELFEALYEAVKLLENE